MPVDALHRVVSPSAARPSRSWRERLTRVASVVRRIVGVPDYDVYLEHMARNHPECTPLDPRAFEAERLVDRYSKPGSRCC
jgi:uncharacterized short protein YbdD (DUF466 family)